MYRIITFISILFFSFSPTFARLQWPQEIKLGLIPTEGGADIIKRFKPLILHLEKELEISIKPFSASDYAGIITAMEHKHIDFAYFGPKSYTEAASRANAQALAVELNKEGQPGYHGLLITNNKSGLQTIDDAVNHKKTFCFTDPNSTSGCLVPSVLFYRDLKKAPQRLFSKVSFSGSHGASILAVKHQKIDVAATNNIDLDRMCAKGTASQNDFNIIWKSELIPGGVMAGRKDLPSSLKMAFLGALMSFNYQKEALKQLQNGGYAPTSDADYDIIRYLKRLKKELQK